MAAVLRQLLPSSAFFCCPEAVKGVAGAIRRRRACACDVASFPLSQRSLVRYWPHALIAVLLFGVTNAKAQDALVIAPKGQQTSLSSERVSTADAPTSSKQRARKKSNRKVAARPRVQEVEVPAKVEQPMTPGDRPVASQAPTPSGPGIQPQLDQIPVFNDRATANYQAQGWRPASEYPNVIDHLPFTFTANETVSYNDNLLLQPNNAVIPPGRSRGDLYSLTTVGLSSRIPLAAQHFFVDGTYGITRYRDNTSLDASNYALNGGIDWVFTSRCSGRLIASTSQVQAPIEELTSYSNNNINTVAGRESAKCQVADNVNVIGDSGLSKITNSLGSQIVNDYDQYYLRGGLEYSLAALNTLGAKVTYTNSDYVNRSVVTTPGLATGLEQTEYAFYYRRLLTPKLEFDGTFGFTESTTTSPLGSSSFTKPTYSATLKWQATPMLFINVTTAATIAPPQNIIADYERIQTNSLSATYLYSPKLTFSGAVGQSHITNPTSSGVGASPILQDQRLWYTELRTNYALTPLTNLAFQYRYTNRKDETLATTSTSNLYMLSLNYRR